MGVAIYLLASCRQAVYGCALSNQPTSICRSARLGVSGTQPPLLRASLKNVDDFSQQANRHH